MPPDKKAKANHIRRNIALCYVRQSFTRNPEDMDSPERQRANIVAVCEKNGWTPEFYEDADKHKTGTKETNRPGWLALKARLGDSDVVALVANDLARLHRKGWRVGDLIDYLDQRGVTLVLAAPGREIDLSTPMGRLFVQFTAILDEWYAADISQRAKDNIAHRKAQGQSVGMPPFGTIRGKDGYLKPSLEGAWLLPNGTFVAGNTDNPPEDGAVFKGYYDAARYILELYATGDFGLNTIAYTLNHEGWAFRDRTGTPRTVWRDDIRRVVANWPEYGGIILDRKAKDRPAYEKFNVEELPFRADRAVFPIDLLRKVVQVRQERTMKPIDLGVKDNVSFYPLSVITYCAHCEEIARVHRNPKLRSTLGGNTLADGTRRYRHKLGVKCGCKSRSVPCAVFEADFRRLLNLLTIRDEALPLMTELAIQADTARGINAGKEDFEKQKQEALALCYRRLDAAVHLYRDGEIDREEYLRLKAAHEREIAHWEARTDETEKLALELAVCVEALNKLINLWDASSDEDRQGLVRSLFTQITYNLDTERIVSFRLKPWAERFLVLRAVLYADEENQKALTTQGQGLRNDLPHRGFEPLF